jgi:hypothetical protein
MGVAGAEPGGRQKQLVRESKLKLFLEVSNKGWPALD